MKMSRGTALVWLLFTEWARADIVLRYDAGTNGSPTSPTNYVFTHPYLGGGPWDMVITPATGVTNSAVTNDLGSGFNAWNVSDNATVSGGVLFTNPIASSVDAAATNAGWTLRARVRMVSNFSGAGVSCFVEYGTGPSNPRYLIFFSLDGSNNLTVQLQGLGTLTLTTNGQGTAAYHLHEIVYAGGTASYYFDGQLITNNWAGFVTATSGNGVRFGSGSTAGKGSMNFNLVEWEIHATKPTVTTLLATNVMAYAATLAASVNMGGLTGVMWFEHGPDTNNPAFTPDQPASGTNTFSYFVSGLPSGNTYHFRCAANNALGDVHGEHVAFTTPPTFPASTLPVTTLEPRQATLSGSLIPSGLPTSARFQWGTTTNYGNQTVLQSMGSGTSTTNVTQLLTNLTPGMTYHYRLVASNVQDTVFGQNFSFTTPPVFIVTNLADAGAGSLRQSVVNALAGDTITFGVTGTVVLADQLFIDKSLTITGATPALIAVSGNNSNRVFAIDFGINVAISGITIRNGRGSDGGPGGHGLPGGNGGDGGGIRNSGALTLSNCVITANASGSGGEGFTPPTGSGTGGTAGGAGGDGGAIFNTSSANLTLINCTVSSNSCGAGGVGGGASKSASFDARPGGLGGNGGGIFNNNGILSVSGCTFSGNTAGKGGDGGDSASGGNGAVGTIGGHGSAIYNTRTLSLVNSTFSGNTAGRGGSGGRGEMGAVALAGGMGGSAAIYNTGALATFTVTACTVAGNSSGAGGTGGEGLNAGGPGGAGTGGIGGNGGDAGGMLNVQSGTNGSLRNCIIAVNTNGLGGAGGTGVIPGSPGLAGVASDLKGAFTTAGHNLFGRLDANASFLFGPGATADQFGTVALPINPLLGPLTHRGGLTPTRSLLPGSPARDTGDDALTGLLSGDQRGYARQSGVHVDIGAFEVQVVTTSERPWLTNPVKLGNGAFQFSFTNVPGAEFTVLSTTNLSLPLSNWTFTTLSEIAPGQFRFTDTSGATNRFYLVRWP